MMAVEGPFLAAVIARLTDPTFNLAAHGVAVAFAILIEAPVIMIMSASTALVEDAHSFRKLRNFTHGLNAIVTAVMVIVLIPPVFELVVHQLIGLPDEVARLTHVALLILLPWPGVIGYRRFYQGLLIRSGRTRLVAYGTIIRLATMGAMGFGLYLVGSVPGAYVGAAALSAGVCIEALASRVMAHRTVRRLLDGPEHMAPDAHPLSLRGITTFYYPLALTSLLGLAVQPMLTFFMGRAVLPVVSLAVYPVVHALSFIFRAAGLSYQETSIALLGKRHEHAPELWRFALVLGLSASAGLAAIALTPLADLWYQTVSGLEPNLAGYALVPTMVLIPLPAMSVFLSFQRSLLVKAHYTSPITTATILEVLGIATGFMVFGVWLDIVGVTAAFSAFVLGRVLSNVYLLPPCLKVWRDRARPETRTSEHGVEDETAATQDA
jgi:hypothetical protein